MEYLFSNVHDALRVVLCDTVEYVERVYTDIGLWVCQPNKCVVEKNVEPLLVELLFLAN